MIKKSLKKTDLIKIGDYKYLIYKCRKDSFEILPIDKMLNGSDAISDFIPKISICKDILINYEKLDSFEILCLLNQSNPLVKEMLELFLDRESKKK